jgi:AraC family transcriptional regulator, ethanolamine operon transcriptional activator
LYGYPILAIRCKESNVLSNLLPGLMHMSTLFSETQTASAGQGPQAGLCHARFTDIDEQAAALDGWNQRYMQLSAGSFCGAMQRLEFDGIGLFIEDLHQAIYQTGYVQPHVVALGVPVLLQGDSQFCGRAGDASAVHVFSGRNGFEFRSPKRHVMLGIEVNASLFDAPPINALHGQVNSFASEAHLHRGNASATMALRRFLLDVFAMAEQRPSLLQKNAQRQHICDELMGWLASAMAPVDSVHLSQARTGAPSAAHTALAERARQFVACRLDDPPTVAQLCHALGVSRRTLQNCFHATWGMGPLAWLNTLRLNVVRHRLKTATSVTEAATQLGFWHFGHFAHDYHALFGELPSETLRRYRS